MPVGAKCVLVAQFDGLAVSAIKGFDKSNCGVKNIKIWANVVKTLRRSARQAQKTIGRKCSCFKTLRE